MKTWVHTLVSGFLIGWFWQILGWKTIFIFIGGVLIDIDHYFWFVYKGNVYSLFKCYDYYTYKPLKDGNEYVRGALFVFHTIEFLLFVAVMGFFDQYFLIFGLGLFPHYMLDIISYMVKLKEFILDHSLIHWVVKNAR